jgi:hypothetical protein
MRGAVARRSMVCATEGRRGIAGRRRVRPACAPRTAWWPRRAPPARRARPRVSRAWQRRGGCRRGPGGASGHSRPGATRGCRRHAPTRAFVRHSRARAPLRSERSIQFCAGKAANPCKRAHQRWHACCSSSFTVPRAPRRRGSRSASANDGGEPSESTAVSDAVGPSVPTRFRIRSMRWPASTACLYSASNACTPIPADACRTPNENRVDRPRHGGP